MADFSGKGKKIRIALASVLLVILAIAWIGVDWPGEPLARVGKKTVTAEEKEADWPGEPLARVGEKTITAEELERAWNELSAKFQTQGKKWFLETLISREILVQEAEVRGLDHSEAVRQKLAQAAAEKLTDELFQREVVAPIEVSEEELRQYFTENNMDRRMEVRVGDIVVKSREEAERIGQKFHSGQDFAQLARQYSLDRGTASRGGDLGYWREGEAAGPAIKVAFSLEADSLSRPIRDEKGYYHLICALDRRPVGFEEQRPLIENRARAKKISKRRQEYMERLMEEMELKVDGETLALLLKRGKFSVDKIPRLVGDDTQRILLTYRGGEVRLESYLAGLKEIDSARRRPNPVDSTQVVHFARTHTVIDRLYPAMARERGLEREESIRAYLEQKRADFMIEELRRIAVEEEFLSETAIRTYYESFLHQYIQPERVFAEAVLTVGRQEAEEILRACRQGADLAQVAAANPGDPTRKARYHVFSFTPEEAVSKTATELIQAAREMAVDEWKGPIALASGDDALAARFAVLHVLERQPERLRDLEEPEVREEILALLRKAKREEIERAFEAFMVDLREKYQSQVERYSVSSLDN